MYFKISVLFNNHIKDKITRVVLLPVRLRNMKINARKLLFEDVQGIFQYMSQSHGDRLLTALSNQSLAPQGTSYSGVITAYNKSHEKGFLRRSLCVFRGRGSKMQQEKEQFSSL